MTDGRRSRDVLGNFPTSAVALTTRDAGERPHGVIAGAFHTRRVASLKTPLLFFRGGYGDYLSSAAPLLDRLVGRDETGRWTPAGTQGSRS